MKLSYIIPVYNVENYLDECIQSIYQQSMLLSDFEVIIINDGSTDGSLEVIKNYVGCYDNIRFFDQLNQGLSITRNKGITYASGDYILFIDSDDFLLPDTVSHLLQKAIDNDVELLRGEYRNCTDIGTLLPYKLNYKKKKYANRIIDGDALYQFVFCKEFYSPLLIMNREFLLRNHIYFEQGVYFEDVDFALKISLIAKRVMYLPVVFYVYRIRQSSITHTINEKKIKDLISVVLKLQSVSKQKNICTETRYVIEENATRLGVYSLLRLSEMSTGKRNSILKCLSISDIRPLCILGGMKERMISLLFNWIGIYLIPFLSPFVWIKNKLISNY